MEVYFHPDLPSPRPTSITASSRQPPKLEGASPTPIYHCIAANRTDGFSPPVSLLSVLVLTGSLCKCLVLSARNVCVPPCSLSAVQIPGHSDESIARVPPVPSSNQDTLTRAPPVLS
uniref:Uncharacterized protein n=1 Tax=Lygus hesperus TaxID=30085 RepID=A0A146M586_LYGHE